MKKTITKTVFIYKLFPFQVLRLGVIWPVSPHQQWSGTQSWKINMCACHVGPLPAPMWFGLIRTGRSLWTGREATRTFWTLSIMICWTMVVSACWSSMTQTVENINATSSWWLSCRFSMVWCEVSSILCTMGVFETTDIFTTDNEKLCYKPQSCKTKNQWSLYYYLYIFRAWPQGTCRMDTSAGLQRLP